MNKQEALSEILNGPPPSNLDALLKDFEGPMSRDGVTVGQVDGVPALFKSGRHALMQPAGTRKLDMLHAVSKAYNVVRGL